MLGKLRNLKNKSYFSLVVVAVLIIAAFKIIMNFEDVARTLISALRYVKDLLTPFIIGAVLAYLLNPAASFFNNKVYGKLKKLGKTKKVISIVSVYVITAALVFVILNMLIPLLIRSVADIINQVPEYLAKLETIRSGELNDSVVGRLIFNTISAIEKKISQILSANNISAINPALTGIMGGVINITGTMLDVVFGIIISVYFIYEKEILLNGTKRILRALFEKSTTEKISVHTAEAHKIFSRFIVGKTIDSLIIGIICAFGLIILKVSNWALFSVIVGVTNMIPYFGPFIGGIPVVLLVLFESPLKAVWTGLFIFALQQFDGMVLGPKILGDSIDLSPFWIIFAILIGGGLFGVMGMFLGAPALAVILLEVNRLIDRRIREKEKKEDMTQQAE